MATDLELEWAVVCMHIIFKKEREREKGTERVNNIMLKK